jgi:cobalt-zinc-cadmium efflux system membrane fusion protein
VVDLHLVVGEVVGEDSDVMTIADLSTVWIELDVPQADLNAVREGDEVIVSAAGVGIQAVTGRVQFVSPIVDKATRTAVARVEIPNDSREWRPGLFVTADVPSGRRDVPVLVPRDAVQTLDGETVVFVLHDGEFETAPVALGRSTGAYVEVVSGLAPGQEYVSEGAYALKAEMVTTGIDAHAGHGH